VHLHYEVKFVVMLSVNFGSYCSGSGYKTNSVVHLQMRSLAQSTAMTEYTVYMCSRMLGMITNPMIL